MNENILEVIEKVTELDLHKKEITELSKFSDDLFLDSISLVKLLIDIETEFGIEFIEKDYENGILRDLGSLINCIEEKLNDY